MNRKEERKEGRMDVQRLGWMFGGRDGCSEVGWMCGRIMEGKERLEVSREEPEEQAPCLSAGNAAPYSF